MTTQDDDARAIIAISRQIKPYLVGAGAPIQGGVLADLVSLWLAGHHPALREHMLTDFVRVIRELVPISEKEIFGEPGFPKGGLS